jgi:carboxymethylenebutenolidase
MFMLPRLADAADVKESEIEIKTPDGTCDAYFVHPASGKHPGVLIWPDIFGLRPAMRKMATRLAESGYSVLVVNPFYRATKAPVTGSAATANIKELFPLMNALTETTHMADARAFVAWLDQQPQVNRNRKIGTQGYCMGGPMTFHTAAAVPGRVGAVASFHGGGLVGKEGDPNSPHLLAAATKASFLIAIAENDDKGRPTEKTVLKETFDKAKLSSEIEVYPAAHGWCPPDTQVYNEPQAEKAWTRLLALYKQALA